MFYGVSKNKNGKNITDYDKYKPWNNGEFSGKIKYELDNGETFEVFREFDKKNPKIFNDKLEDMMENGIHDMDNFIRQLHIRGLMTEELEYFIENYMRFCND